jgi:putative ABC transport system permease protein
MLKRTESLLLRITRRVLIVLLCVYPARFRQRCGNGMIDLYCERFRDHVQQRGFAAGVALFARTAVNFFATGLLERAARSRNPRSPGRPGPVNYTPQSQSSGLAIMTRTTFGDILRGIRFAFKEIRSAPALMTAALLSLTLGIGATTAVFGLVQAVLLNPLPFHDEINLVRIYQIPHDRPTRISLIPLTYAEIDRQQTVFSSMVAHQFSDATLLRSDGVAERVVAISVSRDWLETLGVDPLFGRGFTPDEAELGNAAAVAVISHRLSQREFGDERGAVGQTITINEQSKTIIGVMPPRYNYPYHADIWLPMRIDPVDRGTWGLNVQGRLAAGVSLEQAAAELQVIGTRLAAEHPERHRGVTLTPIRLRETLVQDDDRLVLALFGAVVFVLLIVCANLANLFLARGLDRQRQFAMRAALGASRARLLRENLAENLTVALIGALAGFAFAFWAAQFLVALVPDALGYVVPEVLIDKAAFFFCIAVATACALVFGSIPAWRTSDADPACALQSGTRSITRGRTLSTDLLVVCEIALAFTLLAAAGLMVQNFRTLQALRPGYDAENLWLVTTAIDRPDYTNPTRRISYVSDAEAALLAVPGVQQAGTSSMFPWDRANTLAQIEVDGRDFNPDERLLVNHRGVTPGFLETVGLPLLHGRYFDSRDRADGLSVVIVSQATADFVWPGEDPIGRRLRDVRDGGDPEAWKTVVGVVADVREYDEQPMTWYVPYVQNAGASSAANLVVAARTSGNVNAAQLFDAVASIDPTIAVNEVLPATVLHTESISGERFTTGLLSVFSLGGLLLAAIGIYGVLAYSVTRRVREIGVQLALGASPSIILRQVLRHGLTLVGVGLAAGVVGALVTSRMVRSAIPELGSLDVGAMIAAMCILVAVAAVATYLPAKRAMRADPMEVLKAE